MGYSLTSDKIPQTQLWELATYELKPRLNRQTGVSSVVVQGGQVPEFQVQPDTSKLVQAGITIPNILDAIGRTNMIDSPGLIEANHQLILSLVSGQTRTLGEICEHRDQDHSGRRAHTHRRRGQRRQFGDARLHHGQGERQARGAAQCLPPAGQQYGGGGRCGPRGSGSG